MHMAGMDPFLPIRQRGPGTLDEREFHLVSLLLLLLLFFLSRFGAPALPCSPLLYSRVYPGRELVVALRLSASPSTSYFISHDSAVASQVECHVTASKTATTSTALPCAA
jgi:hypothetical protein